MIAGLGSDIVEIERIRTAVARSGKAFLDRLLTPAEQTESRGQLSYYAGRWAAKEAVAKALGCGIGACCSFTDIEILHDSARRPVAVLSGSAAQTAARLGGETLRVTISHERHYAIAVAVLETR